LIYLVESIGHHRKFVLAGAQIKQGGVLAAVGLYTMAIGYARQHFTNGRIDDEFLGTFPPETDAFFVAKVLSSRRIRLWHRVKGGYLIHDFLEFNHSADKVKRQRELARNRKRAERARKAAKQGQPILPDVVHSVTRDGQRDLARARVTYHVPRTTRTKAAAAPRPERTAAAPQRHDDGRTSRDNVAVITALVSKDILPLRLSPERTKAATIARCHTLGIAWVDVVAWKAIDSAIFRYYRTMRHDFDLPPDPRGFYHDHVRRRRAS